MTEDTMGVVRLHISIRVTVAEMATWSPERIAAFFAGLAQVKAASEDADCCESAATAIPPEAAQEGEEVVTGPRRVSRETAPRPLYLH